MDVSSQRAVRPAEEGRAAPVSRAAAATSVRQKAVGWVVDHPVLTVFIVALVVRLVVVAGLVVLTDGVLARDDQTYWQMAIDRAAGRTSDWNAYTAGLYDETATFLIPLTGLAWVFGPIRVVGQIFVALLGAGAAAFTARAALEWLPRGAAAVAGLLVALVPSQVIFSAALLKDPAVWLCLSALAVAAAVAARSSGRSLIVPTILIGVCLFLLAYLRVHVLIIAGWALVFAALFSIPKDRLVRLGIAFAFAIVMPMLVGAGPGGVGFGSSAGSLEERRLANAERADSAFVDPLEPSDGEGGVGTASDPATDPATDPAGQPATEPDEQGADARRPVYEPGGQVDLVRLPEGISAMLLQPYPWDWSGSLQLRLARLEALVWYPILLLAVLGLWIARKHLRAMAFPIFCAGGLLLVYALVEGNIGTAYRHRGDFVWTICLLAAAGSARVFDSRAARRQDEADEPAA